MHSIGRDKKYAHQGNSSKADQLHRFFKALPSCLKVCPFFFFEHIHMVFCGFFGASFAANVQRVQASGPDAPGLRQVAHLTLAASVRKALSGLDARLLRHGWLMVFTAAAAQPLQNPLNLPNIVAQSSASHPSVRAAVLDTRASEDELAAARYQRWPVVSAVLESNTGNAASTASRALRLEQTVWDAGRVNARIGENEVNVDINLARTALQQQLLALQAANAWQGLLESHAKVKVAQATLDKLQDYRAQIQRRIAAEVSPPIDLELVQSRMLQTEVELINAQTNVKTAITRLQQISGLESLGAYVGQLQDMPGLADTLSLQALFASTDWELVAASHPSVNKARFEIRNADFRFKAKQAEQWPQVYVRLDQPMAGASSKTAAFVGLRYSPGAGLSTLSEAQALASRTASLEQTADAARREIFEALNNDRDEFNKNRQRLEALQSAVQGADRVLGSYGRQFTAGRKTWQDLMNAVRELAQNQYALVEANASMLGAMYRLQIRMGQGVFTSPEVPRK